MACHSFETPNVWLTKGLMVSEKYTNPYLVRLLLTLINAQHGNDFSVVFPSLYLQPCLCISLHEIDNDKKVSNIVDRLGHGTTLPKSTDHFQI